VAARHPVRAPGWRSASIGEGGVARAAWVSLRAHPAVRRSAWRLCGGRLLEELFQDQRQPGVGEREAVAGDEHRAVARCILERDQQKWIPVLRPIALQARNLDCDPIQLDRITV
jgi:hypothetical protein